MFGLETLDVLIGLATVYLAFGVACTAMVEAVTAWLGVRSKNLEAALNEFLAGDLTHSEPFVAAFYRHPLVQALSKGKYGRPSYIPPEIIAQVVEGLVTVHGAATSLAAAVSSLPGTPDTNRVKGLLEALVTQARGDGAAFRKAVETHFNATMDRASGWFKRYTQRVALVASAVLVIGANVDTVALTTSLVSSPAARAKVVEIAAQRLTDAQAIEDQALTGQGEVGITPEQASQQTAAARAALDRASADMESAGLRFGWKEFPNAREIPAKIAGLLVSIFAVSLGAPFWFDLLQRVMQVRGAGVSPREEKEK